MFDIFDGFVSFFNMYFQTLGATWDGYEWTLPSCDNIDQLPDLVIQIDGRDYPVTWRVCDFYFDVIHDPYFDENDP